MGFPDDIIDNMAASLTSQANYWFSAMQGLAPIQIW